MARDHGPTVKNDRLYEELRKEGNSKEKAARIANANANPRRHPLMKGGKASPYERWTKDQLFDRAREIGIAGRSGMNKSELIHALRSH